MATGATSSPFAGLAADSEGDDDSRAPLLLLHGLTFDRTMWRPALDELRRIDPGRRVLAVDLPGHGGSAGIAAYDGESVMRAVHASAEAARLRSPVVVGHSIGAIVATFYAGNFPTSGVVNVDQPLQTAPFSRLLHQLADRLRGPDFDAMWQMFLTSMHPEVLSPAAQELVRTTSTPVQELVLGYWAQVLDSEPEELAEEVATTLAAIRKVAVPYEIVTGSVLEADYRSWLNEVLPGATITVLPGSGHFPHLGHPEAFARVLASTASWPAGFVS